MKRAAVIGAGGFLGRHLVALLAARGYEVGGVSLEGPPPGLRCDEWLACDLTQDAAAVAGFLQRFAPDTVFHLAATSFEPLAASQPWLVLQNNLLSALTTLTACRGLAGKPACVIVSSSAVYGRQMDLPVTEERPLHPLTIYGVSKLAVEALALQHCRAYGLRGIIVRPFNVTGPGEHASFVTSALARQIALIEAGRQAPRMRVGDLRAVRDFTDVRDAVAALVAVAEAGQSGEVYNVCSGVGVTIDDLAGRLLRASTAGIGIEQDPALMRPVEIDAQFGDATKLTRATGWEPRYQLDRTLQDVLDDWRQRIGTEET